MIYSVDANGHYIRIDVSNPSIRSRRKVRVLLEPVRLALIFLLVIGAGLMAGTLDRWCHESPAQETTQPK